MDGKLIALEGGDGSGKATQAALLVGYFMKKHTAVNTISFPRYTNSFYGKFIGRFLQGEFGSFDQVSPYIAALMYALDRKDAQEEIVQWLNNGDIVIADRYVTSNLAHQAAKLPEEKQEAIISWIEEMEYDVHKMPRPDKILYLHVPPSFSMQLISSADADIAEHPAHQKKTEEVYQRLFKDDPTSHIIECVVDGKLRSKEDIHAEIVRTLQL